MIARSPRTATTARKAASLEGNDDEDVDVDADEEEEEEGCVVSFAGTFLDSQEESV